MFFDEPFGGIIPGARGAVLATLLRTGTPLTGRQLHGLVEDHYSLWSIQEALKTLADIGLVKTRTIGRAGIHEINEDHTSVTPLRQLLDPIASLTAIIEESLSSHVQAVILFGSIARGEATATSDIDLAVIADDTWDGREDLEDLVRTRTGNPCDVLVFTAPGFESLAARGEPVVDDILRDGVALIGSKPVFKVGASG